MRPKVLLVGKYVTVGILGGVLQSGTLYLWVDRLHLESSYLTGAALGFLLALAVTFTLQKYWTFGGTRRDAARREFSLYTMIAISSLLGNLVLLEAARHLLVRAGVDFFEWWYLGAQVVITLVVAALSFILNYVYTFRRDGAVVVVGTEGAA